MTNMSIRKIPLYPKLVPKTPSTLPEYRDFYPSKLAIKTLFDSNPIETMTLETARKMYDRCEKHHLGGFIPGHHPDRMSMEELHPQLYRQRQAIENEMPEALEQSLRIKRCIEEVRVARTLIPKKIY